MSNTDAHSPCLANGLWCDLAVPSGGDGVSHSPLVETARGQEQECPTPHRVAPRVRHHGAVPLVEDLLVAGLALAGIVLGLPVLLVGRREHRGFGRDVRRGLRIRLGRSARGASGCLARNPTARRGDEDAELDELHALLLEHAVHALHVAWPWSYGRRSGDRGWEPACPRQTANDVR